MEKRLGYFKLAQVGGTELLVYWSLPTGGVLVGTYALIQRDFVRLDLRELERGFK